MTALTWDHQLMYEPVVVRLQRRSMVGGVEDICYTDQHGGVSKDTVGVFERHPPELINGLKAQIWTTECSLSTEHV